MYPISSNQTDFSFYFIILSLFCNIFWSLIKNPHNIHCFQPFSTTSNYFYTSIFSQKSSKLLSLFQKIFQLIQYILTLGFFQSYNPLHYFGGHRKSNQTIFDQVLYEYLIKKDNYSLVSLDAMTTQSHYFLLSSRHIISIVEYIVFGGKFLGK